MKRNREKDMEAAEIFCIITALAICILSILFLFNFLQNHWFLNFGGSVAYCGIANVSGAPQAYSRGVIAFICGILFRMSCLFQFLIIE